MSHLDDEVLAGLALGEAPESSVAAHLAGCTPCQEAVSELRGVLTTARHASAVGLVAPPAGVWESVRAEVAQHDARVHPGATDARWVDPRPAGPRRVARGPADMAIALPRRRLVGWLAAAAAAGAVAGAGGTWLFTRGAPLTEPVARAELTTLDTREVLGEADVFDTPRGVALAVRTQALDPRDGYLEVWLINRDLARMVSVGVLPADQTEQSFPIARRLLDEGYVVVDISREAFDDRPEHSGDSLVRGELAL